MGLYVIVGLPFMLVTFGQSALPFAAIPAAVFFAMGTGIGVPPLQSLATSAAADSARGAVVGLTASAQSLGVIGGTLLAGPLLGLTIEGRPSLAPYLFSAVMFALLILPSLALVRRFGSRPLAPMPDAVIAPAPAE